MATKKKTSSKTTKSNSASPAKQGKSGNNTKTAAVKQPILSPRIKAILFAVAALIFLVLIFVKGENVWTAVRSFFFGVFGFCIFLVPVLLIYLAVITEKEKKIAHIKSKSSLCALIILLTGALIYVSTGAPHKDLNFFACIGNLYLDIASSGEYMTFGAGFIGGILGYPLCVLCGSVPAVLICIILLCGSILIIAKLSLKDIGRAASKVGRGVTHVKEISEQHAQMRRLKHYENAEANMDNRFNAVHTDFEKRADSKIDIPLDEPVKKKKKKANKPDITDGTEVDIVASDEANAKDKDISQELINIISRASKPYGADADTTVEHIAEDISREKTSMHIENGAKQPDPETVPIENTKEKTSEDSKEDDDFADVGYSVKDREDDAEKQSIYHYPPVQLLSLPDNSNDANAMAEMQNNATKLIETLDSFGVKASIVNISRGPSVTRYELAPAPGVKISKITNLSDDIALNLAANGVRIEAPIPGKAAVGIEVPNKIVSMVSMRELIDSDEFRKAKGKLTCVLGKDISGSIVVTDLAVMPHLLIAGTTGSGKSVCVNSILISILYKATPDEVKLLLIDPKMVEFSKYKGIPHLLVPVVSDAKKAAGALSWAVSEMLQRYKIFSEYDCKNITAYNALIEENLKYIKENPPEENEEGELVQPVLERNGLPVAKEKMPQIVIAIDELADLMMAAPSEVEESICRLAQMARAAGMHLLIATQRPTVNVITGLIKANIPSRIALKVSSNMDSRTILDLGGAEKLIGRGDMLFSPVAAPKPIRVQGCFASDEEIEKVTGYIKKSFTAQYNSDIEEKIKRIAAEEIATGKKSDDKASDSGDGIDVDSKMEEAIKCVIEAGQASTSLLQRRLKVGYARAGRMIDDMEQMGVVGPHQGSKPRDVLMTYNEWLERSQILGTEEE